MIGYDIATELFGIDEAPSTVRVRTDPDLTEAVWSVLAETANPEAPDEVDVTRPSDALEAKSKADDTLTALLLGLGAVALLVGGVGIANVMVISVPRTRAEMAYAGSGPPAAHTLQFLTSRCCCQVRRRDRGGHGAWASRVLRFGPAGCSGPQSALGGGLRPLVGDLAALKSPRARRLARRASAPRSATTAPRTVG